MIDPRPLILSNKLVLGSWIVSCLPHESLTTIQEFVPKTNDSGLLELGAQFLLRISNTMTKSQLNLRPAALIFRGELEVVANANEEIEVVVVATVNREVTRIVRDRGGVPIYNRHRPLHIMLSRFIPKRSNTTRAQSRRLASF